jgi:prolyl-tRNA synthetase
MRLSQLLGITLRHAKDTELASHELMLRAGYVRQVATGIYAYLHLGQRSLQKIEAILREEIERIGGVEISLPLVQPAELWRQTGRYDSVDHSLVRFADRAERDLVLGMTHEEVVAFLTSHELSSYKQLPKLVYQIQTKFRDELRPRGGLIRVREFTMKDSYSLDSSWEGLQAQYEAHYHAYYRIGARVGLPVTDILSDVGMMGGRMAHEFMYLTPVGEDTIFLAEGGDYRANKEVAHFAKAPRVEAPGKLTQVETPEIKTIEALSEFLSLSPEQIAKTVAYVASYAEEREELTLVMVPGHLEVNEIKVKNHLQALALRPAEEAELLAVGATPGYMSAVGLDPKKLRVIVDDLIATQANWVVGANLVDAHLRNAVYQRDFHAHSVGDLVSAYDGAPAPDGQGILRAHRGVEVGNIFQLGTTYTAALNATFMDVNGKPQPIIMGSYGIGVGRLLACLMEEHRDEAGLIMPVSVTPYHVNLVLLPDGDEVVAVADRLYAELKEAGVEVLYDDRDKKTASPGIKFKDADLRGFPVRITVSGRAWQKGGVEVKLRRAADAQIVAPDEAVRHVRDALLMLQHELDEQVAAARRWQG